MIKIDFCIMLNWDEMNTEYLHQILNQVKIDILRKTKKGSDRNEIIVDPEKRALTRWKMITRKRYRFKQDSFYSEGG